VDFANPAEVKNIITRVTDAPSNINGTLGVLGNANLFFINPNGIFFGQNARLDLAGTFVGSTANGLKFDATGDILIAGNNSGVSTSTLGNINGGNILINANNFQLLDGAYLETSPYASGNGGNISIETTNTVRISAPTNGEETVLITGAYRSRFRV
jgi:filamentous hemagglutinin family protein